MNNTIKRSTSNGVLMAILNRPEKLNACNSAMYKELLDVLDEADANDAVRAVIFTGEGRAFCAGGELPSRPTDHPDDVENSAISTRDITDQCTEEKGGIVAMRMYDSLKPLIAAINGVAIGFGATMVLPMDIRLASTKAKFSFPFTSFGGLPEAAASWFLPRTVGMGTALEWCLTGDVVSADVALEHGLVRSLHDPTDLLEAANELALRIAAKAAPVSAAVTRHMLWRLSAADHPMTAHLIGSKLVQQRVLARDMKEGVLSFFEKRQAVFPDQVSVDMPSGFPWWHDAEQVRNRKP
jgi:enoyl-CoA hydratase/carnithine racemase